MTRFMTLMLAITVLVAPAVWATDIEVTYSEDFATKIEEDYGEREGEYLVEDIREDLQRALERRGVDVERIDVVINDAKPNKPTFKQLTDEPSLDRFRSRSIGGMDLTGTAYDSQGKVLVELQYDYFENDIRDVFTGATWWDAQRASSSFARKMAKRLEKLARDKAA